jgi:hypothetical protein
MASFAVITPTPPPVTATSGSSTVTYNQIVQSQSVFVFKVLGLYLKGSTVDDVSLNLQIVRNTPDGQSFLFEQNIDVSPFQIQPSVEINLEKENIVFDGYTSVNFSLPPLASLQMLFVTKMVRKSKIQ